MTTSPGLSVFRAEAEAYQRSGALFEAARRHVHAGDKTLAFALLDDLYKRRYPGLSRMKVDPDFDPVRSDPRFQNLLARVGLG